MTDGAAGSLRARTRHEATHRPAAARTSLASRPRVLQPHFLPRRERAWCRRRRREPIVRRPRDGAPCALTAREEMGGGGGVERRGESRADRESTREETRGERQRGQRCCQRRCITAVSLCRAAPVWGARARGAGQAPPGVEGGEGPGSRPWTSSPRGNRGDRGRHTAGPGGEPGIKR